MPAYRSAADQHHRDFINVLFELQIIVENSVDEEPYQDYAYNNNPHYLDDFLRKQNSASCAVQQSMPFIGGP